MSRARRVAWAGVVLAVVAVAGLGIVRAAEPAPRTQRQQVDAISATIRCPTCQGLSIKDSSSVLASGARKIVEDQVAQGRTPDQIRQYFVERYGPWILLSPPSDGPGLLVWALPLLVVPAAGVLAWRWVRDRRVAAADVPVGAADGDGEAASALAAYRAGELDPDSSPAGEALREALLVRAALDEDAAEGTEPDADALARADARLAAAARRYRARAVRQRPARTGPGLPRRAVTVLTVGLLVVGAGAALAVGVRARGANGLPTGDLPGGPAANSGQIPDLLAATRARPQDGAAWLALGRAYAAAQQDGPAVEAYDQAIRFGAGDDAALQRAAVLVRTGRAAEALPALAQIVPRRPDDPDTLLLLGLAQRATGAPDAAATLRRFLQVAPGSPDAAGVRDLLAGR